MFWVRGGERQGYSSLCFGKVPMSTKSYLKTVGSKAYVQFTTFVTYNAINEGCICTCKSLIGVLDTVENRTRLPSALGQTLQRLSAQRTMRESSLVMGIGGT